MSNKLCLGTVQFGLKYGINNEIDRQPTDEESFSVLKVAIENGIDYFDTASVYGNAEEILGEFDISKYGVKVISKLRPDLIKSSVDIVQSVQNEVKKSLQRINVNRLDGYLLHEAKDFYHQELMKGLQICKEKNLVKNIGVSIYEPEDALNVVKSGIVDYIQIPYNVFDQRLDETDFFAIANKNDIKIFARSAFLQGLLLMDVGNLPECLKDAKRHLKKFNEIIETYGYAKNEAAFLFSYAHKGIDKVVFGVETERQLKSNLLILNKLNDFTQCYHQLIENFKGVERKIIIPSLWK